MNKADDIVSEMNAKLLSGNLDLRLMFPSLRGPLLSASLLDVDATRNTADIVIKADLTLKDDFATIPYRFRGSVPEYLTSRDPLLGYPRLGMMLESEIRKALIAYGPIQSFVERDDEVLSLVLRLSASC